MGLLRQALRGTKKAAVRIGGSQKGGHARTEFSSKYNMPGTDKGGGYPPATFQKGGAGILGKKDTKSAFKESRNYRNGRSYLNVRGA